MRTISLLALILSIQFLGVAQESNVDAAGSPEAHYGAQAYRDPHSGIILYVESDARRVSAISSAGKLLWTRDPFKDAHLEFYRTKQPQIAQIGPGSNGVAIKGIPRGFVYLEFNSSQFGRLRISDGEFFLEGQN
jgi:hypothetical protein